MKAIYAGSFDPITNGHIDIITKASKLFDEILILVSRNSDKNPFLDSAVRTALIRQIMLDLFPNSSKKIEVISLPPDRTVVEIANQLNYGYLIRGLRNFYDLNYEQNIYNINKNIDSSIETVFFMPELHNSMISSSNVRELYKYDKLDIVQNYVPRIMFEFLKQLKNNN